MTETKRLFFGLEVEAPWPEKLPSGRILDPSHRHLTLAFLGNVSTTPASNIPLPSFSVGLVGQFDKLLLLPPAHPHVVAWHVNWWDEAFSILTYQKKLVQWLKEQGYHIDDHRDFLPHVTLCRTPFDAREWEKQFMKLPMMATNFHLYESVGNLRYEPIWSYPLIRPFEEIEHTADIAFIVRGENLQQIQRHALTALAFHEMRFMDDLKELAPVEHLDDIIMNLNRILSKIDQEHGSPFKAVSYHGEIQQDAQGILSWEMIVDV